MAEAGGYLTVAEVAALLRLKQRRVYALARAGTLPSRRVTGRLLFARDEVAAWLEPAETATSRAAPPVLVGSHDPLLDWALRESGCGIASFCDGSLDGLARLARGEAVVAGVHLFEGEGGLEPASCPRAAGRCRGRAARMGLARAWPDRGRRQSLCGSRASPTSPGSA